ncbi:lysosomal thioesterase PPT2-A [Thecamonas trahens ATCC 50062]|uniref:Lysosomal thioesterase PPT2-A n=1 Tax=Thecamonas trahens ATCC 50062 TaxID=461836 RepID=A0A0L0DMF7_THETB|nr:lysosomal thioesterase PPT2-A [Thecamonas trahens ATCC 50062]KNC53206.1 lysosomal thioesterase PPT2-A [Thecamonas trahens ATCC 50062]|eukprot:XP_013754675.1 lysosomal thioesterase PPT2-A [Thecamonas trahens ATCC 50062]
MPNHIKPMQLLALVVTTVVLLSTRTTSASGTTAGTTDVGYLPVFAYHGFGGSGEDFATMAKWVEAAHPGQDFVAIDMFNGAASYKPMWEQVDAVAAFIRNYTAVHGLTRYHVIGHSQGAIAMRTLAQSMDDHNIASLISLAGPQMGQFGSLNHWPAPLHDLEADLAWIVLYTKPMQATFSAAGYWNDPYHQKEFCRDSLYLAVANNVSLPSNPRADAFRANILRLGSFSLLGSPDDGTIQPWESTMFGFWSDHRSDIVPLEDQPFYKADMLGLRSLAEDGRLHLSAPIGVSHMDWVRDEAVFRAHILPLLT